MTLLGRLVLGRYTGLLVALVAVGVYLALTEEVFLTWDNLMNIGKSNSVVFVLAIGATFVVISAGIDLSIASAATAAGMILGLTMDAGWSIVAVLAVTLLFALCLGVLNGVLITRLRISFLVVTLGTLSIYLSFALVVNGGQTISVFGKPGFSVLSDFVNDDIGPFPVLLVFDLALLLVAGGVLRYSGFGRSLFAVGSNPEAARLNGINVGRILLTTYALSGLAAGLASIVQVGRLTGASAQADPTLLLTVIAAVLIGGTTYTGGEGGVLGTLIGVLFLGVVQNGLTLADVPSFWQGIWSLMICGAAMKHLHTGTRVTCSRQRSTSCDRRRKASLPSFAASLPSLAASPRILAASPPIESTPPRSRSAMLLNAAATFSPTRSAACTALAEARPPTRSRRFSSARRRRSISPMSAKIARECPD